MGWPGVKWNQLLNHVLCLCSSLWCRVEKATVEVIDYVMVSVVHIPLPVNNKTIQIVTLPSNNAV